jgi:uncharacterized small protein (TIGR04563 family)
VKASLSLWISEDVAREIDAEARRTDRTLSWLVQRAWRKARREIGKLPADSLRAASPREST